MTAYGTVAVISPVAVNAGTVVPMSPAASHAKAPATISGPIRLLGRRSHAATPAAR
jgi:hypothetical protein